MTTTPNTTTVSRLKNAKKTTKQPLAIIGQFKPKFEEVNFPAINWKLQNLEKLKANNPDKHRELYETLENKLKGIKNALIRLFKQNNRLESGKEEY